MATITRGVVTLSPAAILGWSLTRPGRSVVHTILGSADPVVTVRAPGLRAGTIRTVWLSAADALSAAEALSVVGGSWTWTVPERGLVVLATVVGDVSEVTLADNGRVWAVDVDVQERTP